MKISSSNRKFIKLQRTENAFKGIVRIKRGKTSKTNLIADEKVQNTIVTSTDSVIQQLLLFRFQKLLGRRQCVADAMESGALPARVRVCLSPGNESREKSVCFVIGFAIFATKAPRCFTLLSTLPTFHLLTYFHKLNNDSYKITMFSFLSISLEKEYQEE